MSIQSAYYNGTPLQMLISVEQAMKSGREMIKLGLQMGESMETQKKDYKEQLDIMEQELVDAFGVVERRTLRDVQRLWGDKFESNLSLWYMDIAALLIMKVIKDDNDNGFLVIEGDLSKIFQRKAIMNTCVVCAKRGSFKKCSICKTDYYCGEECQKTDWKRHKATHK
jgi:hypothetical protein